MADGVKFKSNISQVITGLNMRLINFKRSLKDAFEFANINWITRIIRKYLSGGPGLKAQGGKAAASWKSSVSVTSKRVKGVIYSRIPGHAFNYIMAHEDPQIRHTAFGRPSKPWRLPKRTDIFGDWQGEGGKRYVDDYMDIMASKGVI